MSFSLTLTDFKVKGGGESITSFEVTNLPVMAEQFYLSAATQIKATFAELLPLMRQTPYFSQGECP